MGEEKRGQGEASTYVPGEKSPNDIMYACMPMSMKLRYTSSINSLVTLGVDKGRKVRGLLLVSQG